MGNDTSRIQRDRMERELDQERQRAWKAERALVERDRMERERDQERERAEEAEQALEDEKNRGRQWAEQARMDAENRERYVQEQLRQERLEGQRRNEEAAKLLAETRAETERRIAEERQAERARIHAEELEQWNSLNREYPLPDFLEGFITKVLEDSDANDRQQRSVNVGVLGNSGTGKSSLLKVVIAKFPTSPTLSLPASCCEGDGTRVPTPYRCQDPRKRVHIWDLPGQGTAMFPSKTYLRDMGLKYFDAIIITTDGRWTENDRALYHAIKFAGMWFIVVRTKVDLAVDDCLNDHGISQADALAFTRASLAEHMPDLPHDRLHLVTARKKFWNGTHGDIGFGTVDALCEQVAKNLDFGIPACLESTDHERVPRITCESLGPSDSVSQGFDPSGADESSIRKIALLRVTRHPLSLKHALAQHHELWMVRADLERTNPDYIVKIGTDKVFLFQDEYSSAIAVFQWQKLGRHHLVVSEKLLPQVMEVIDSLPHKENVRVKEQQTIAYLIPDRGSLVPITTRGTFLEVCRDRPGVDLRSVVTQ